MTYEVFAYGVMFAAYLLWLPPMFMPRGRWFSASVALFLLVEVALWGAVFAELSAPNRFVKVLDDSPAVILLPLIPIIPAILFLVGLVIRLIVGLIRRNRPTIRRAEQEGARASRW